MHKSGSGTSELRYSRQSRSAEVELQIFGSDSRLSISPEAETHIFESIGRVEVELHTFGGQGRAEVRKRNFRSLVVEAVRK